MPRLAGQQPEYIEAQLRAFIERRRTNPIMFNVAHVLSPSMTDGAGHAFSRSRSQAVRRSAKGIDRDRQKNLRGRASRIQRSRLLRLSRHGGQGPKRNSAPCGSALRIHCRPVDGLEHGARSGLGG